MKDIELVNITNEAVKHNKNPVKLTFENVEYEVTVELSRKE